MKYLLLFVYGFVGIFIVVFGLIFIDCKLEILISGGLNFIEWF